MWAVATLLVLLVVVVVVVLGIVNSELGRVPDE